MTEQEANEKQKPMKPIQIGVGEGWKCPVCGTDLHWKENPYCRCGQHLEW